MATPVGPAPRDPDDPDLWDEWYGDEEDEDDDASTPSPYGWPIRLVALLVAIGIGLLFVLSR